MEIIYDKNIPLKGFKAMTIWPFIFVRSDMKGYFTANGYYGLVGGRYVLFASESDYNDYMMT